MVQTISPNKVSGPNNDIKKHMIIPTTQLLFTHTHTHAHTLTHTHTQTFFISLSLSLSVSQSFA